VSDPPPAAEPPAPPKTKNKRKKAEAPPAELVSAPRSEAIAGLIAAFDAGNYALVRERAPAVMKSVDDPDEQAIARDLLRRINPDPIAKWMMMGAGLLLAFLAGWYWSHAHGGP
jgi:hypothetical protein